MQLGNELGRETGYNVVMKRGEFDVTSLDDIDPLEDTYEMLKRSPTERLQLLEQLRSFWYDKGVPQGLQRVIEVLEQE